MRKPLDRSIMIYTNDDGRFTNTKPRLIQFGEHILHVKGWTDALQKVCDKIAEENPSNVDLLLRRIKSARRPYFTNKADNSFARPYKVRWTDIFVECNLDANNTKELLDGVSTLFGYGELKVELW